jgi:hypothetical protein
VVDAYVPYPGCTTNRTLDAYTAVSAMMPHHGRFRFIQEPSLVAVGIVVGLIGLPDFVYIDGSHDETDVADDLRAWWDVIPPHGMMAGHDYDPGHPGVMSAVESFARERGLIVRLTHRDFPPSWLIYRTEPARVFKVHASRKELPVHLQTKPEKLRRRLFHENEETKS